MPGACVPTRAASCAWLRPAFSRSSFIFRASCNLSNSSANSASRTRRSTMYWPTVFLFRAAIFDSVWALGPGCRFSTSATSCQHFVHPPLGRLDLLPRRLLALLLVCMQQHNLRTGHDHVEDSRGRHLELPQLALELPRDHGLQPVRLDRGKRIEHLRCFLRRQAVDEPLYRPVAARRLVERDQHLEPIVNTSVIAVKPRLIYSVRERTNAARAAGSMRMALAMRTCSSLPSSQSV